MTPGEWMSFPVPADQPLAQLEIVVDGTSYPAFRENDHAMIRCPDVSGAVRVEVRVNGSTVHREAVRVG